MSFTEYQNRVLATDQFVLAGGIKIAVSDTGVEISTLTVGTLYVASAVGADVLLHQDTTTAVSSNGNFDVCVTAGSMIRFRAIDTLLNVIEADATSAATAALYIAEVDENILVAQDSP